jgi:cytoskeletal protein CcmA (bactofilin family)
MVPLNPAGGLSKTMSSTFSVIGSDITIKGDVSATSELHIDGRVEGDIQCTSLVQGEASVIRGSIEAETARLAGTVNGSITARELIVMQSARIEGDVHYEALTIEQGASVEGHFGMRSKKDHQAKVAAAAGSKKVAFSTTDESLVPSLEENGLDRISLAS